MGQLCDKLCDFFRADLHCFTRFQRRKTTLMFDCKGVIKHLIIKFKTKWLNLCDNFYPEKKKDTCLILHDAVTLLTTLLVSEIKMAAQIPRSKVSDVL